LHQFGLGYAELHRQNCGLSLTSFEGEAHSRRMPGAAETMGIGAAVGTLATSAALSVATHLGGEAHGASTTAEARRLADNLARQIGHFAA
jgi:hypothetical protein